MSYFKPHDYKAICDLCGFEYKASELKKQYDGLMVCAKDWSPRHPAESFRHRTNPNTLLPWTRPDGVDQFITTPVTADDL